MSTPLEGVGECKIQQTCKKDDEVDESENVEQDSQGSRVIQG
jgi:hypothetical protein